MAAAPSARPLVVFTYLGQTLDAGGPSPARWKRWRPTVALGQLDDLVISRLELLYSPDTQPLLETIQADLASVSPQTEVRPHVFEVSDPWALEEVYGALHDVVSVYPFQPEKEDYLVHITTGTHVFQICLFLLVESRHIPGRLLQLSPPKPKTGLPGQWRVIDLDLSKYDQLAARFAREQAEGLSFLKAGIQTQNGAFNRLVEQLEQVAGMSKAPILFLGPTGAGKSQLARRVYELKKARRQVEGPFVEVNCATLRGDGAMSALFGHVKGAFTGAVTERPGLLRRAAGGLLFLDEIGELGLDEQAMLLRALEEKCFLPVGSDREVHSDFQLLAGTHRDLFEWALQGHFREDLLARINLWTFDLPPLRARTEDLEPNLDYELSRFARDSGRRVTFNAEARHAFLDFARGPRGLWRGNFREFNAAITRMATLAEGGRIRLQEVEAEVTRLERAWRGGAQNSDGLENVLSPGQLEALDRFDRVQLADVVRVCRQSRSLSEAGRVLFAASRQQKASANDADRLRKYLARFELEFAQLSALPSDKK